MRCCVQCGTSYAGEDCPSCALARRVEALEKAVLSSPAALAMAALDRWTDQTKVEERASAAEKTAAAHYATAQKLQAENEELRQSLFDARQAALTEGQARNAAEARISELEREKAKLREEAAHDTDFYRRERGDLRQRLAASEQKATELEREKEELERKLRTESILSHTLELNTSTLEKQLATARAASGVPVELVRKYVEATQELYSTSSCACSEDEESGESDICGAHFEQEESLKALSQFIGFPDGEEWIFATAATPAPEPAKPALPIRERCPGCGGALSCEACAGGTKAERRVPSIMENVLAEVAGERGKQERKWGQQNHHPFTYLAVLGEEVGEANQAALQSVFGGMAWPDYRKELIQIAAVAVAMVECHDRNGPPAAIQEDERSRHGWSRRLAPRLPVTWEALSEEQQTGVMYALGMARDYRQSNQGMAIARAFGLDEAAAREGKCVMKGEAK